MRDKLRGMNKLPAAKRVQILSMLVEGSSMRSISRVADVSINTVAKLLAEAGRSRRIDTTNPEGSFARVPIALSDQP